MAQGALHSAAQNIIIHYKRVNVYFSRTAHPNNILATPTVLGHEHTQTENQLSTVIKSWRTVALRRYGNILRLRWSMWKKRRYSQVAKPCFLPKPCLQSQRLQTLLAWGARLIASTVLAISVLSQFDECAAKKWSESTDALAQYCKQTAISLFVTVTPHEKCKLWHPTYFNVIEVPIVSYCNCFTIPFLRLIAECLIFRCHSRTMSE